MSLFSEQYKKLNPEQRQAVDTIDGPVLVVAGPGTGKTQLLSMRVANILKKTDVDPNNILCLTYTNKASINMRERILELTNGEARNVMVKTFHSFCAELMNTYPNHFWNGAKLTTAPDVIQDDIIQTVLKSLPFSDPLALKFAGQYTAINDIKDALRLSKEAGLTPSKLQAIIQANLAYIDIIEPTIIDLLDAPLSYKKLASLIDGIDSLPEQGIDKSMSPLQSLTSVLKESLRFTLSKDENTNKTTNTGKWKQEIIQNREGLKGMYKERDRNLWWLSLSNVYQLYRKELHSRNFYDYSDMLVEVISALEQNPGLRSDIQEQYQYVLIDEFQDTNSAQMRLAHLVAEHESNVGKPNIMAVGDDDQSIFKFNGAELANMLTFKKDYPTAKIIVLSKNYRSTQPILDTAEKIITQASDRLILRDPSINKHLVAVTAENTDGLITHQIYLDQDHQYLEVCNQIKNKLKAGPAKQSIAVLARNHESLRRISARLVSLDIPVSYSEQNNILEHQLVNTTYQIAKVILAIVKGDVEQSNYLLSIILRHPMWELDAKELWNLAINNQHKSWMQGLLDLPPKSQLKSIAKWLNWLSTISTTEPLRVIIEHIIGIRAGKHLTSPLHQWTIDKSNTANNYIYGLSALRLLLTLVDEYSRYSSGRLEDFVNYVESAIESKQIIADETPLITGDFAVELLTVHKAKGLEFDTVYLVDAVDDYWKPRHKSRKPPANLPLQPAFDDTDDYIRLMYVVATRAKHSLIINSYKTDAKGGEVLSTPLISNILTEEIKQKPSPVEITEMLEESITWPSLSIADEASVLKPRLQDLRLSASGLLDFLDVTKGGPALYKEQHILRLPGITTANMSFGTAIHDALEYAQILTNKDNFNLTEVQERYSETLTKLGLTKNELNRYLTHGQDLLSRLLTSDTFWLPKGALPEQSINDVVLNDVPLYGKLDRVQIDKNQITVVDYKTGTPLGSFFTKSQSQAVKAWRHRTQLAFYALLVKHCGRFSQQQHIKGQMIYLEASTPNQLIREYSPSQEELERLERLIKAVWNKITALEFSNTTSYEESINGITKFEEDLLSI